LWDSCQAVGGLAASDQRQGGRQIAVRRHERLSAGRNISRTVNARQQVDVCAGFVKSARRKDFPPLTKNQRKNAKRRVMAKRNRKNAR
jgi:hypothetical protein